MKKNYGYRTAGLRLIGLCLALLVLPSSPLYAQSFDTIRAGRISNASLLWSPGKLAVDSVLALFAVDGYKNRIQKFDRAGNPVETIKIDRPSAVAVSRDGTLYIGSHRNYSVGIYKDGRLTGYLGEGKNEFSSILDIAVDEMTGDIYVADGIKNSIKSYYSSGILKATFSGFNAAAAVAVSSEDVYVLDAPGNRPGEGAGPRISVFSKSGSFIRGIDERGKKERFMTKPLDITVDPLGNIFVADAGSNSVLVYDKGGVYAGEMRGGRDLMKNAVALALSPDNRLYVSSSETHSILEIGLAGTVYSGGNLSLDFQSKTGSRLTPAALGY